MKRRCVLHFCLVAIAAVITVGCSATEPSNPDLRLLGNRPIADRLVRIDTAEAFTRGTSDHVKLVAENPVHLELSTPGADRDGTAPVVGTWTSEPIEADFGFTEGVASWNVMTPADTGVRFFLRTRDAGSGEWSPWLYTGQWGRTSRDNQVTKFPGGSIDVDTLMLEHPGSAWQIRAELQTFSKEAQPVPSVRRIAFVYSGAIKDQPATRPATQPDSRPARTAVNLPVPFRAQHDTPAPMRHQVCSPTSTTMVLAFWGFDRPTAENCKAIWDSENHLYGNWNRAVARAGEMGLDAWVTRFRNWDDVRAELDAGRPIIAAIEFKEGEFPGNVLDSTDGHLIVIRGMTAGGDIICNDPASKKRGNAVVYKADALAQAWFEKTAVGYVIRKAE